MNNWTSFDFLIFLILVMNVIQGMSRGTAKELISLMCLSVALIFTIKFTIPLANFFNKSPLIATVIDNPMIKRFLHEIGAGPLTQELLKQVTYSINLLICFTGIFCILEAALSSPSIIQTLPLHQILINRKISSAIGLTRGYIISLVFLSIVTLHIYDQRNDKPFLRNSFFIKLFQSQTKRLDDLIRKQQPEGYRDLYTRQPDMDLSDL